MLPTSSVKQLTPPIQLVKTWCLLLREDNEETYEYAKEKLLNTFGNMQNVVKFVREHNIKV
jgi:hypothetical protein